MSKYDVVVVGGGQNSLSAAAYLAAAGMKVLVLDKNSTYGGGAVSHQLTAPGFIHDPHATAARGREVHRDEEDLHRLRS